MGNEALTVRLENVNFRVKEEFIEIIRSVKGLELVDLTGRCNLLILEIGRDPEKDFRRISEIQASGEADEIFLTALQVDSNMLIKALRSGVKEFIPQPLKKDEMVESLLKFLQKKVREREKGGIIKIGKGESFYRLRGKGRCRNIDNCCQPGNGYGAVQRESFRRTGGYESSFR